MRSPWSRSELRSTGFLYSTEMHEILKDYAIGIENLFINWTFAIMDLFQLNHRIFDFVRRNPNRSPHGRIFHLNPNVDYGYLPPPKLLREHFRQDTKGKGARVLASQRRPGGEY